MDLIKSLQEADRLLRKRYDYFTQPGSKTFDKYCEDKSVLDLLGDHEKAIVRRLLREWEKDKEK